MQVDAFNLEVQQFKISAFAAIEGAQKTITKNIIYGILVADFSQTCVQTTLPPKVVDWKNFKAEFHHLNARNHNFHVS